MLFQLTTGGNHGKHPNYKKKKKSDAGNGLKNFWKNRHFRNLKNLYFQVLKKKRRSCIIAHSSFMYSGHNLSLITIA